jgi:hypothetical protein
MGKKKYVYYHDWFFDIEMYPMCSLQRHHRLTNGVTITQALRCRFEKG